MDDDNATTKCPCPEIMKLHVRQIAAVTALPGRARYEHFVKLVADRQEVWGLYESGWALAGTDEGMTVFPLWPAREYAQLCAEGLWLGYQPRAISLDELMDELLQKLKADGLLPGVFYTPSDRGVTPAIDELRSALEAELENY